MRENQRLLAWHAANVMAPHVGKRKITVAKLMGESRTLTDMDPEQRKEYIKELRASEAKKDRRRQSRRARVK